MRQYTAAAALLFAGLTVANANEGMWTFNNFPLDKVEQAYGFAPVEPNDPSFAATKAAASASDCWYPTSATLINPKKIINTADITRAVSGIALPRKKFPFTAPGSHCTSR